VLDEISKLIDVLAEHASDKKLDFIPGTSPVPVSGKVYGATEIRLGIESILEFWLTAGKFCESFESELKKFLGCRTVLLCNSGSSANLLAVSALTNRNTQNYLQAGDEVITAAVGFPTTVGPIIQNGLVPVFIDVSLGNYNILSDRILEAVTPKTKAIMIAHALGNPFDIKTVLNVAKEKNLFVIEDTCDALGSTYEGKKVGTFGDMATLSFYPAHHITTGEGGAVILNKLKYKKVVESIRDWGRDCWCPPGIDNTCAKRFSWQLGQLPFGYDHKYSYSNLGYNLKLGDVQAAIGLAQMSRLEGFIAARKANWQYLHDGLMDLSDYFILPEATLGSDPSWFGFALTIKNNSKFDRNQLISYLDSKKIGTRMLFGGNLTLQPAFQNTKFRIHGDLLNSDLITNNTFWIGVWPGLTNEMLDYMINEIKHFIQKV
jgi:CDP-6-deoxy-D-xylo-4-hexulose-3-dehydrase